MSQIRSNDLSTSAPTSPTQSPLEATGAIQREKTGAGELEKQYGEAEQMRRRSPGPALGEAPLEAAGSRRCASACTNVGMGERAVSVAAGAVIAGLGLSRGRLPGLLMAALGGSLVYRGVSGHCYAYDALGIDTSERNPATVIPAQKGCKVEKAIAINRAPKELYSFWRDFENLPQVMKHLKRVDAIDRQRSHWVAEGVMGYDVEWDAEIYNERENEMIAWRSLPGAGVDTAGSVHFRPLPNDRGTEVRVSLKYNPPGGKVGATIASLLGSGLEGRIAEDLRNFKRLMETGEIPTTADQPAGRCSL